MKRYFSLLRIFVVAAFAAGQLHGQNVKWVKHTNRQFGYSIKYPSGWKVTIAGPRRDNKAVQSEKILMAGELHRIAFTDTADQYWQATLAVRVLELPGGMTFGQWLKEYEASDTTDFNPVEQIIDTTISGHPAKKATLFNFDHTGQELILQKKRGIMLISYEGLNPNDRRNKWHMEIFGKMLKSFKMEK